MPIVVKIKFCAVCIFIALLIGTASCSKSDTDLHPALIILPETPAATDVTFWLTSANQGTLFAKQNIALLFEDKSNGNTTIEVDTTQTYQSIDGFGFTLTGGSASLIHSLSTGKRADLLDELFSTDSTFIGISYLRISIGASDLSSHPYTYNDIPSGQPDVDLSKFSLESEKTHLIPLLKEILAINPNIKIMSSPWSAPVWMKTNNSFVGGSLKAMYYPSYANYFVKYLQGMAAEGIKIDAITIQNEPLNPYNNPSMLMSSLEQGNFIKNNLGSALASAGLKTKIILYDHNCDVPSYPLDILADPRSRDFTDGSAFHLYAGNITTLSQVHNAYPQKNIYFTEQWTSSTGDFGTDLNWHVKNLVIGATRNWSKNVLEWNLANNIQLGPYTAGGCTTCLGALTIDAKINRNVSYYIIAHASKFVRPGSIRVNSNIAGNLQNVAFQRADGKKVLIVLNDSNSSQTFNIKFRNKIISTKLAGGSVGTFVW